MNISNRSLVLMLLFTIVLVGGAAVLIVGQVLFPPPEERPVVTDEVAAVPSVTRMGGTPLDVKGPLLVAVQDGVESGTALLVCDMYKSERPFVDGGMSFESIPIGDCTVKLSGTDVAYGPVYPGDTLECRAHERKTMCDGGIASDKAGTVTVRSAAAGRLFVDGEDMGPLPLEALRMKVGKRELVVRLDDGRKMTWKLVVQPDELIEVDFPAPPGTAATPPPAGATGAAPPAAPPPPPPASAAGP